MRYIDTLLTEGEQIVYRTRQHWLAVVSKARTAILLWLIGLALLLAIWFMPNLFPGGSIQTNVVAGVALILIVIGLLIFIYRLWQWWAQDFAVSNRRLIKVTGILNKRASDSSLEKVNDAILFQSLWGRMLNFGNLEVLTASDTANDMYYMINAPKEFKKMMLTQKHQLETEFMYGRPPTPPLRANEPMPPMAPQAQYQQPAYTQAPPPSSAPAPAPEASMAPSASAAANPDLTPAEHASMTRDMADVDESLEVTETLSRLADLRDQGAISAEEYEQKKDELLGRL